MEANKRLKIARAQTNMTQAAVAEKLGVKQPYYARLERGEREIPREKLIEIAKLFKVSTDFLLGLTDEQTPYPPSQNLE